MRVDTVLFIALGLSAAAVLKDVEADQSPMVTQCAVRLRQCLDDMKAFQAAGVAQTIDSVRQQGLRRICADITAGMQCLLTVVLDPVCEQNLPPMLKKFFVKSNAGVNFACVERIDDFEKHWNCIFNADVDTRLQVCENFETSLQQCSTEGFVRCAEQAFASSDLCEPGASELMRDTAVKIIDLMPNCSDQKNLRKMLLHLMKK